MEKKNDLMRWRGGYRKKAHPQNKEEGQGWEETEICDTLNIFDYTELRTPVLIVEIDYGRNREE